MGGVNKYFTGIQAQGGSNDHSCNTIIIWDLQIVGSDTDTPPQNNWVNYSEPHCVLVGTPSTTHHYTEGDMLVLCGLAVHPPTTPIHAPYHPSLHRNGG